MTGENDPAEIASSTLEESIKNKMGSVEERFQEAATYIRKLPKTGPYKPSNDTKLMFYGWYKQATIGECKIPKPGFFKFVEKKKWEAWHKLGTMTKEEAMECYVKEFDKVKAATERAQAQQGI